MQIPDGPKDLNCHRCLPKKVSMAKVCRTCDLWMRIVGLDKTTGEKIDDWMCADRAKILFLGDISKSSLSGVAATESFRNEMVQQNEAARVIPLVQIGQSIEAYKRLALPNHGNVTGGSE